MVQLRHALLLRCALALPLGERLGEEQPAALVQGVQAPAPRAPAPLPRDDDDDAEEYPIDPWSGQVVRHKDNSSTIKLHGDEDPDTEETSCDWCEVVIDLRCPEKVVCPHCFWHRLSDCFIPVYGNVLQVSPDRRPGAEYGTPAKRCYLAQRTTKPLEDALRRAQGLGDIRFVESPRLEGRWGDGGCGDKLLPSVAHPYSEASARAALRLALLRMFPVPAPNEVELHALVIQREQTRAFGPVRTAEWLTNQIRTPQRAVKLYTGDEPMRETMELFARASAVVGYHGAGAANLVFTPGAVLSIELTTLLDGNPRPYLVKLEHGQDHHSTHPELWRTNARGIITAQNPSITWWAFAIPKQRVIDHNRRNNANADDGAPLDVFLKGLPWVPLDDDVVGGIVEGINQWDQKHPLGAGVAPSAVNSSNVQ